MPISLSLWPVQGYADHLEEPASAAGRRHVCYRADVGRGRLATQHLLLIPGLSALAGLRVRGDQNCCQYWVPCWHVAFMDVRHPGAVHAVSYHAGVCGPRCRPICFYAFSCTACTCWPLLWSFPANHATRVSVFCASLPR